MLPKNETTAIIRDVDFGLRDVGIPCLSFTAYTEENVAALQCFTGKEIGEVVGGAGVYSIRDLEGQPCTVRLDGNLIKFVRVWPVKRSKR